MSKIVLNNGFRNFVMFDYINQTIPSQAMAKILGIGVTYRPIKL